MLITRAQKAHFPYICICVCVLALETVRGGLIIMESGAWGTISIFPLLADYNMDCRRKPRISDKLFTKLDGEPFKKCVEAFLCKWPR